MRSLIDLQDAFARAMTTGDGGHVVAELIGGARPKNRLAVHLRHYAASLTDALCGKFPACAWLAGADVVRDAARMFARAHPPERPCIAEYGRNFPHFLAPPGRAQALPYLESFAELEWALGQASVATDRPPLAWTELARLGPERLADATLTLQPGVHYVHSSWRIDELMSTYLGNREPERFVLVESDTFLEVRGARGAFGIVRLDGATHAFRAGLRARRSVGGAAERALERDGAFDAGEALRRLVAVGLVIGCEETPKERAP